MIEGKFFKVSWVTVIMMTLVSIASIFLTGKGAIVIIPFFLFITLIHGAVNKFAGRNLS